VSTIQVDVFDSENRHRKHTMDAEKNEADLPAGMAHCGLLGI
jgi:hypothetical protein